MIETLFLSMIYGRFLFFYCLSYGYPQSKSQFIGYVWGRCWRLEVDFGSLIACVFFLYLLVRPFSLVYSYTLLITNMVCCLYLLFLWRAIGWLFVVCTCYAYGVDWVIVWYLYFLGLWGPGKLLLFIIA